MATATIKPRSKTPAKTTTSGGGEPTTKAQPVKQALTSGGNQCRCPTPVKKVTAGKQAETTFTTKWDDGLAVIDVYEKIPNKPQNAAATQTTSTNQEMIGIVKEAKNAANEFSQKIPTINKKAYEYGYIVSKAVKEISDKGFNKENITDYVLKETAKSMGYNGIDDIKNLSKIGGGIAIDKANEMVNGNVKLILDNFETIKKGDFNTVDSIAKMVGQVTGNPDIAKAVNAEEQMGMIHGLVNLSMQLGLPELTDKLIDNVRDKKDKTNLKREAAEAAATAGNMDYLSKLLKGSLGTNDDITTDSNNNPVTVDDNGTIKDTSGNVLPADTVIKRFTVPENGSNLNLINPNVIPNLLQNYTRTETDYNVAHTELDNLVTVLSQFDPQWDKVQRNGTWITNLAMFKNLSNDAIRVLSQSDYYGSLIEMSKHYDTTPGDETFYKMYPYALNAA